MRTYKTTYREPMDGLDYEAIEIPTEDIAAYFGRPHEGTSADDRYLKQQLFADGAPEWVLTAPGYVDGERGRWGLIGPELPASEPYI